MPLKKQSGYSLVEVMAVTALLGVTVLAGASLSNYLQKTSHYADSRSGISALERMIGQRLNDQGLCKATLGSGSGMANHLATDSSPVRLNMPNLQVGDSPQAMAVGAGTALPSLKLNVTSLQIRNATNVAGSEWVGDLYLQTTDADQTPYKDELVTAVIMTVANGVIDSCHANSTQDSQQVCTDMGCTFNANTTPNCQCSPTTLKPCTQPQQYPVTYDVSGNPTCVGLGDSTNCPVGQYLTGVQLSHKTCSVLGTPTPTPAATTPVTKTVAASTPATAPSSTPLPPGVCSSYYTGGYCPPASGYAHSGAAPVLSLPADSTDSRFCSSGSVSGFSPTSYGVGNYDNGNVTYTWICQGSTNSGTCTAPIYSLLSDCYH